MRLARSYEELRGPDIEGFVRFVDEQEAVGAAELEAVAEEEGADAVRLLTIHAAKGLEFKVVVVADAGRDRNAPGADEILCLADGRFGFRVADPVSGKRHGVLGYEAVRDARRAEDEAERLRLYYVAMTRAIDRLIVSRLDRPRAEGGRADADRLGARAARLRGRARGGRRGAGRARAGGRPRARAGRPDGPTGGRVLARGGAGACRRRRRNRPARALRSPARTGAAAARARARPTCMRCPSRRSTTCAGSPTARLPCSSAARTATTPSGSPACAPPTPAARSPGRDGLAATEVGDAVHRLLELVDLAAPTAPDVEQRARLVPGGHRRGACADRRLRRDLLRLRARAADRALPAAHGRSGRSRSSTTACCCTAGSTCSTSTARARSSSTTRRTRSPRARPRRSSRPTTGCSGSSTRSRASAPARRRSRSSTTSSSGPTRSSRRRSSRDDVPGLEAELSAAIARIRAGEFVPTPSEFNCAGCPALDVVCAGPRLRLPAARARGGLLVRVAVLCDVHGNLPALEAVLAEVAALGVDGHRLRRRRGRRPVPGGGARPAAARRGDLPARQCGPGLAARARRDVGVDRLEARPRVGPVSRRAADHVRPRRRPLLPRLAPRRGRDPDEGVARRALPCRARRSRGAARRRRPHARPVRAVGRRHPLRQRGQRRHSVRGPPGSVLGARGRRARSSCGKHRTRSKRPSL